MAAASGLPPPLLAVHDLGGRAGGPPLVLLHANGFPSMAYAPLVRARHRPAARLREKGGGRRRRARLAACSPPPAPPPHASASPPVPHNAGRGAGPPLPLLRN